MAKTEVNGYCHCFLCDSDVYFLILPPGGNTDVFFREPEGQHSSDKFRVGRNSLDIFSPVRDGERILLHHWSGYLEKIYSVQFLSTYLLYISLILDYKGHRLSDASSGKKGEICIL